MAGGGKRWRGRGGGAAVGSEVTTHLHGGQRSIEIHGWLAGGREEREDGRDGPTEGRGREEGLDKAAGEALRRSEGTPSPAALPTQTRPATQRRERTV